MKADFPKITFALLAFTAGVAGSLLIDSHLNQLIRELYKWTTGSGFVFYGKQTVAKTPMTYYLAFGLITMVLWSCFKTSKPSQYFEKACIFTSLFTISVLAFVFIDGRARLMSCESCTDGFISIYWNSINYSLITIVSLSIALLPLVKTLLREKQAKIDAAFEADQVSLD